MPRVGHLEVNGPLDKVGTTYVATMRLMGFETKTTYKIVEVEPLRLIHALEVDYRDGDFA